MLLLNYTIRTIFVSDFFLLVTELSLNLNIWATSLVNSYPALLFCGSGFFSLNHIFLINETQCLNWEYIWYRIFMSRAMTTIPMHIQPIKKFWDLLSIGLLNKNSIPATTQILISL